MGCQKACVLPENPASYRVVRKKSYLFNKAFDPLTSTKTFVHIPRHINNVARLKTCRFNKPQTVPEQTSPKTIPPPEMRLRPTNTTIRQWRCCWCDTHWHGDKVCPKCRDLIYVLDV
ncbi:hypothetical protein FYK35_22100 [Enterobacter hormaechei]|nr:hypothetical protein FYK35_22100 [Enterobacter hormaechei]